MQLKIYNTLSREKELFVPLMEDSNYKWPKKDFVWLYSCGPTVYRESHIGNMRAYVCRDVLRNALENVLWYKVTSVINMTDVWHLTSDADEWEDKMEKWAKRDNMTVWELADKYITSFKRNLHMLNIDEYKITCRATDHIKEQIVMIQQLEEKWYIYLIPNDGVYMDTSKIKDYGYLAKLDIAGLQQWARIENDNKKNKTDFGLRKFSPKNEHRQMERDSPWGRWFPGRHIECSAMATKYLGEQFDIHTWWVDHIPVHHVNEIAQSECALGTHPRVKYWMHNQFLNLGWKKIAKSAWCAFGDWILTIDVLVKEGFNPLDFRYLCLTAHYRSFLDFNPELLQTAANSRNNLIKKMQKLFDQHTKIIVDKSIIVPYEKIKVEIESKFVWDALEDMMTALMDDLNTPQVLAILNQSITAVDKMEEVDKKDLFVAFYRLEKNLLKIWLFDRIGQEVETVEIPDDVKQLADQRLEAKQAKDYAHADEIRKQILDKWREVKDTKEWYEVSKI